MRPRSIRLDRFQSAVVAEELHRLRFVCNAVEVAPEHDGDKALRTTAPTWERSELRVGPWPREWRIPILATRARVRLYDHRCLAQQQQRRHRGLAFRDFESPVFYVVAEGLSSGLFAYVRIIVA